MSDSKSVPAEPGPHPPKRAKLVDEYNKIDKRINDDPRLMLIRSDDDDDEMILLLGVIQGHLGVLDTAQKILKDDPSLKDKLRKAWEAKSYREILHYLKSLSDSGPSSVTETPWRSKDIERTEQVLRNAWKEPFRGEYHKVLLKKINAMYEPQPYKNTCAIVQSSGTGKSRMVDELAKLVFTLPINIRRSEGINAAYPPPDDVLRDHLVVKAQDNEGNCRTHYKTFFQCLFHHSLETLSKLNPSDNDLASEWYKYMDEADNRRKFYEDVVDKCEPSPSNQSTLKDLMNKLRMHSATNISMVIYIDEAHELKNNCGGRTRLEIMCSVMSDFCNEQLFFLLLSTQSSLHFLAPTREAAASERVKGTTELLAPITETPFDCFWEYPIESGALRMKDLSTLEYVAKWGRPLWWTMVDGGASKLIGLARMKLLCDHEINKPYDRMKKEALIAVLDVLLAFDFEPNRELSEDIQAKLVKSHMRIAYSVPQHRLYFRSGYPSEPLLAEAAAQQILRFRGDERNGIGVMADMLTATGLLESTLIDSGQRGEVFMRMCLMGAYVDGVLQDLGSDKGAGIIFSKGCKLTTFIEQLFEDDHAERILDAKPDNILSATTFRQAFAQSMVRFTHFVKAGDPDMMTSEAMFAAFIRGMAFIGYQTQLAVDFAIPVLLNREDTLQEFAMSAILIQVKRHVRGHGVGTYKFRQEDVDLFPLQTKVGEPQAKAEELQGEGKGKGKAEEPQGEPKEPWNDERPYITLIAQLGIEPEEGILNGIKTPTVYIPQQPKSIHHPEVHPRYTIVVYGCKEVYRGVDPVKRAYHLATRNFFAEHPNYGVTTSGDLVMRLKPVWQRGENSFHWLDEKLLRKPKKRKEPEKQRGPEE